MQLQLKMTSETGNKKISIQNINIFKQKMKYVISLTLFQIIKKTITIKINE